MLFGAKDDVIIPFMISAMSHPTLPDWANVTEDIACPLCAYDLRGLAEPCCPECGYTFDWPDLIDPTRRLHPYLFEHHPERNFRSFWRTTGGAMRPGRFWRSVLPAQPSQPRRLVLYWLLVVLVSFLCLQACLAWVGGSYMYKRWQICLSLRPAVLNGTQQVISTSPEFGAVDQPVTDPILLGKYADRYCPNRITATFVLDSIRNDWGHVWAVVQSLLVLLLWPWVSFAALMVFRSFRRSTRRARLLPVHVLRCTIYCSGTFVAIGLLGIATSMAAMWGLRYPGIAETSLSVGLGLAGLLLVWLVWQLAVACRLYLKLPDATATVVCSQLILVLAVLALRVLLLHAR